MTNVVIYPIPHSPAAKHSPRNANKTSRRQRGRSSFAGVFIPCALIAVAALSLGGVLIAMRYVTLSLSPQLAEDVNDSMLMPANSLSNDKRLAYGVSNKEEDETDSASSRFQSTDEQEVSSDDDDVSPSRNFQRLTDDSGDETDLTSDLIPGRIFFNKEKGDTNKVPSHSLHRQTHFPRIISIEGDQSNLNNHLRSNPENARAIRVSSRERDEQERLLDSDDFSYRDPLYEGDCVPMQKWQETSFPNCNLFHELDFLGKSSTEEFEYYTHGGYNDIFWLNENDKYDDPELVMKILKYGTKHTDRNFDRVRRDGLILERLTPSPYVLDIYGFCGFDVLTPFADGGTFSHELSQWERGKTNLSPKTRLKYAVEIASGLADVHDIDGEGLSSVAHGDLKGGQYLFLDGVIKLGDFNRGRFLRRNSTAPDTACTYTIGKNDAAFRSPEEYEYVPQSSAIDVWALGSIFYQILTGHEVWYDTSTTKAQKYIRKGKLPIINEKKLESQDPVDVALREAIDMCYVFDPIERAKAADVASYLRGKYSELTEE